MSLMVVVGWRSRPRHVLEIDETRFQYGRSRCDEVVISSGLASLLPKPRAEPCEVQPLQLRKATRGLVINRRDSQPVRSLFQKKRILGNRILKSLLVSYKEKWFQKRGYMLFVTTCIWFVEIQLYT